MGSLTSTRSSLMCLCSSLVRAQVSLFDKDDIDSSKD